MSRRQREWGSVDWIYLAQYRGQWRALVNMNHLHPYWKFIMINRTCSIHDTNIHPILYRRMGREMRHELIGGHKEFCSELSTYKLIFLSETSIL
jgi:hypothetical protein